MPCFPWLFILNSLDLEKYVVKVQTTDLNCVTLLSKSNINIIFFKTWEFKWERAMKIWWFSSLISCGECLWVLIAALLSYGGIQWVRTRLPFVCFYRLTPLAVNLPAVLNCLLILMGCSRRAASFFFLPPVVISPLLLLLTGEWGSRKVRLPKNQLQEKQFSKDFHLFSSVHYKGNKGSFSLGRLDLGILRETFRRGNSELLFTFKCYSVFKVMPVNLSARIPSHSLAVATWHDIQIWWEVCSI